MKLYKIDQQALLLHGQQLYFWQVTDWDALINRDGLYNYLHELSGSLPPGDKGALERKFFDAPIGGQEVWAAGVTYLKSKQARMEESHQSGGDLFYDLVYDAPRPELFFKATAQRTVGTGQDVYIRRDSQWNVPEPELTLFVNSQGSIEGYTIGNDMSSRSIEGENPLYLPQAKVYERCASLGPCLYVTESPIDQSSEIRMEIHRQGKCMFKDQVKIDRMKRTHEELVSYLFRECRFPRGVFLMTGTCLVPDDDFTLQVDDEVRISIDHIGTLCNRVTRCDSQVN